MALLDLFRSTDVERLQKKGDWRALTRLLGHRDAELRGRAARALGHMATGESALTELAGLYERGDDGDRRAAVEALCSLRCDAAAEPLGWALADETESVRILAAQGLLAWTPQRQSAVAVVTPAMLEALRRDPDGYTGRFVGLALAKHRDPGAASVLIELLGSGDREVRARAAEALGTMGDVRAVLPLVALLSDQHCFVRLCAARTLGQIGDVRAAGPLRDLLLGGGEEELDLWDPDHTPFPSFSNVRERDRRDYVDQLWVITAQALTRVSPSLAVQAIATFDETRRPDSTIGLALWRTARAARGEGVLEAWLALLDRYWPTKVEAVTALGDLGDVRALEPLTALMAGGDAKLREQAEYAVDRIRQVAAGQVKT